MMLSLLSIRKAIVALLRTKFPKTAYQVHFDNVEKSKAPYFYVELTPHRSRTFDAIISERSIEVDVMYFGREDAQGNVKRSELYDVAEVLDALFRPVFFVEDRAITINEAQYRIVDEILHFTFALDFADAFTEEELSAWARTTTDLMQTLELNIDKEERTYGK